MFRFKKFHVLNLKAPGMKLVAKTMIASKKITTIPIGRYLIWRIKK